MDKVQHRPTASGCILATSLLNIPTYIQISSFSYYFYLNYVVDIPVLPIKYIYSSSGIIAKYLLSILNFPETLSTKNFVRFISF